MTTNISVIIIRSPTSASKLKWRKAYIDVDDGCWRRICWWQVFKIPILASGGESLVIIKSKISSEDVKTFSHSFFCNFHWWRHFYILKNSLVFRFWSFLWILLQSLQFQNEPKMVNSLEPSFFLHQLLRHLCILAGVLQREIANSMSHSLYTELSFRRELFESLSVTNQRKWFDCCSKMVVGLGWFSNYFDQRSSYLADISTRTAFRP